MIYRTKFEYFSMTGSYYSKTLNRYTPIPVSDEEANMEVFFSPHYTDTQRKNIKAIEKYRQGEPGSFYYDKTGNVEYKYDGKVVIRHSDSIGSLFPL